MVDSEEMGVPCDQEPCGGFLELNWPQGWFPVETLAWQRDRRSEQVGCSGDGSRLCQDTVWKPRGLAGGFGVYRQPEMDTDPSVWASVGPLLLEAKDSLVLYIGKTQKSKDITRAGA